MQVKSYKYLLPDETGLVPGIDRDSYMTPSYIDMVREYIESIELKGKVAFLYVGGVTLSAGETRNTVDKGVLRERARTSSICIKELTAYHMHKWIGSFKGRENIEYANISANTCASSMYSLYEASKLLDEGYDEVIIVAEEKTSYNTLRVFDEHNIDLKVGEGLAIIHLEPGVQITDCKWQYKYNRNPFGVDADGYRKVFTESGYVKPHGTGTANNEQAENEVFGDKPQLRYKETIGHTQGISGLLELCLVLDEDIKGDVLCVASGLGGFYGSCVVHK